MILGMCPLSIVCSRGTPPREIHLKNGSSHVQILDMTVLYVSRSLDSGWFGP